MKKGRNFRNFNEWHAIDIERKLGVKQIAPTAALEDWIKVEGQIPTVYQEIFKAYRQKLLRFYTAWNETELLMQFIGPVLASIDFETEHCNCFGNRPLQAQIGAYHVQGIVDWMLASGSYEPENPYFFLHEYKRFQGTESDPRGQVLIAMLATQTLNKTHQPIYGCYVTGYNWRFILLEGNTYSESQAYDATNEEELSIIWLILNKTKAMIETLVQQEYEEKS